MIESIKNIVKKLPYLRDLFADRDRLREEVEKLGSNKAELERAHKQAFEELNHARFIQGFVPPGHFYSPIPDFTEFENDKAGIFDVVSAEIPGIDLNSESQLELLNNFLSYYAQLDFEEEKKEGLRYAYNNPAYGHSDGIFLNCMIRHLEPTRIIEVGSGHSSCMTLDTNELHFENKIKTSFIEPYPKLLYSLIKESDRERIRVIPERLQDVDINEFKKLKANDILFIDSTHVSKIGSDVNRALFEILPALAPGVHIHFHDIMYPFEYPKEWVLEGRAWNESYMLKAFLQYNRDFSIVLMNTYMEHFHRDFFEKNMPLCLKNPGGSIWLRKN